MVGRDDANPTATVTGRTDLIYNFGNNTLDVNMTNIRGPRTYADMTWDDLAVRTVGLVGALAVIRSPAPSMGTPTTKRAVCSSGTRLSGRLGQRGNNGAEGGSYRGGWARVGLALPPKGGKNVNLNG